VSSGLVVDAHHHFWPQPRPELYPWLTEPLAGLRRPFGPDDLRPLLEAAGVDRTVLVQTRSSLDESIDLLATAAGSGFTFTNGVLGGTVQPLDVHVYVLNGSMPLPAPVTNLQLS